MTLFLERGYAAVTVAEIGRQRRPDQTHVLQPLPPDKRKVLFAGAQDFEAGIVKHLTEAPDDLAPIDAAIATLTYSSLEIAQYSDYAASAAT